MAAEKVAKTGISRDKDFMYYIKDGAVSRVRRKQPGVPKGKPEKVVDAGVEMDTAFIYFLDKDGDVREGGHGLEEEGVRDAHDERRQRGGRDVMHGRKVLEVFVVDRKVRPQVASVAQRRYQRSRSQHGPRALGGRGCNNQQRLAG